MVADRQRKTGAFGNAGMKTKEEVRRKGLAEGHCENNGFLNGKKGPKTRTSELKPKRPKQRGVR